MKKEKNRTFILTLDLKPEIYQVHLLEKRFNIARQIYNSCLGELLECHRKMKSDVRYIEYSTAQINRAKSSLSGIKSKVRIK